VRIRAFTGGHSHEQYNRFPTKAPVATECLPDHIGAKQARMLLALFELKDAINDLTRLVESGQHIAKPSVGSEQISA
jgi:transposase